MVQQWLTQNDDKHSADSGIHVLKNLISFPTSFIKHKQLHGTLVSFDDEDVNAWGAEARRWARVLLLVITKEQQLEPIAMVGLLLDMYMIIVVPFIYFSVAVLFCLLNLLHALHKLVRRASYCLGAGNSKSSS